MAKTLKFQKRRAVPKTGTVLPVVRAKGGLSLHITISAEHILDAIRREREAAEKKR
jgi:hypothetical protein